MLHKINPTTTKAWQLLQEHYQNHMQHEHMKDMFKEDETVLQNILFNNTIYYSIILKISSTIKL